MLLLLAFHSVHKRIINKIGVEDENKTWTFYLLEIANK